MNLNISYILEEHGWSTCLIYLDEKIYEVTITHIFSMHPPIESCIQSLLSIMNGETKSSFYWYGESGGEKICLTEVDKQKNKLKITAIDCESFFEDKDEVDKVFFEFYVSKKELITHFYFEFKKISVLMKNKNYENNRGGEFPFQIFRKFEDKVLTYLEIG